MSGHLPSLEREKGDDSAALALYCNEATAPAANVIEWWTDQGVSLQALTTPLAVLATRVVFQPSGTYIPNALGEFAHVLPAFDADGLADLVAWSPRSSRMACRLGNVSMLGETQVRMARATGDALHVWRNPLSWLRAGRRGVVILEPEGAAVCLAGLSIVAEDDAHARALRATLKVRPPRIALPKPSTMRAAA